MTTISSIITYLFQVQIKIRDSRSCCSLETFLSTSQGFFDTSKVRKFSSSHCTENEANIFKYGKAGHIEICHGLKHSFKIALQNIILLKWHYKKKSGGLMCYSI